MYLYILTLELLVFEQILNGPAALCLTQHASVIVPLVSHMLGTLLGIMVGLDCLFTPIPVTEHRSRAVGDNRRASQRGRKVDLSDAAVSRRPTGWSDCCVQPLVRWEWNRITTIS